jgi:membrane protein involved in colicin uptake
MSAVQKNQERTLELKLTWLKDLIARAEAQNNREQAERLQAMATKAEADLENAKTKGAADAAAAAAQAQAEKDKRDAENSFMGRMSGFLGKDFNGDLLGK